MTAGTLVLFIVVGSGVALWLVSLVVEAMRPTPAPPTTLRWAPEVPIRHVNVGNCRVRYIIAGTGPSLVLLHTLRTQLDLFEKVIPGLAKHFTVYALDYPGHGYSDIPKARYDADFFLRSVEGFLEALDLRGVTLCGVSIGASISLNIAGRRNSRVDRIIAINPYDYYRGRGLARSSFLGRLTVTASDIPVVGETFMRLRNFLIVKGILEGGVADPTAIPMELLREMNSVGNRPGHYRAFLSLLRNSESWEEANKVYATINVPALLIWAEQDWSTPKEREEDRCLVSGARTATVQNGGHFLPLDRPQELHRLITRFAGQSSATVLG
jgi:pimeloyl-ACP methyl ester carboxylesterase